MTTADSFKSRIFDFKGQDFSDMALELFDFQYHENKVYREYCHLVNKIPSKIHRLEDIPYLPIEFYKTHAIKTGIWDEQRIFLSSGTTSPSRSRNYVRDINFYHDVTLRAFKEVYGEPISNFQVIAYMPHIQHTPNSSLLSMLELFIENGQPDSRWCQDAHELGELITKRDTKRIVFGVSYALLSIAEKCTYQANETIFIETGGMKGKRKELVREDLHSVLKASFNVPEIHSEYGMTELASQAYANPGNFIYPNWVKVTVRDINDPFSKVDGKVGGLNIIDLANVDTCAFIETKDIGRCNKGRFTVLGRFDNADIRGCNLLF